MNKDYEILNSVNDFINNNCLCFSCVHSYSHRRVSRIIEDLYEIIKYADALEEKNEKAKV